MKYLLYPLFGATVIGAYAVYALSGGDIATTPTQTRTLPADVRGRPEAYGVAPIIWFTGFHGPAAYRPSYRSGGGSYGGGSYGGFGGFGGGK